MDWDWATETNRAALKRVLAMLVAMAGLNGGDSLLFSRRRAPPFQDPAQAEKSKLSPALTLSRRLHRAILRLLRPAESAARRLVIVFARNVVVTLAPLRPRKPRPKPAILRNGVGTGIVMPAGYRACPPAERTPLLPLTDRLRRPGRQRRVATGCAPRILFPGFAAPSPVRLPPAPGDLPAQAKRFARWRARRDAGRIRRPSPLRAGRPPGHSRRPAHEVHAILDTLHDLAFRVLEPADTS